MLNKKVLLAAIIAIAIATICVAAQGMTSANKGESALKLMAFISFFFVDIYILVAILKEKDN